MRKGVLPIDLTGKTLTEPPVGHGWRALAYYRFEIILFLLLAITLAAVRFQDALLSRTIVIEPRDAAIYAPRFFGDQSQKGTSTIRLAPHTPMQWRCTLRAQYAYPFCSYEILLDARTPEKGIDLTHFDTVTLDVDYRGPSETFRLSIKNFDPRYSTPGAQDTLKYNKAEIRTQPGRNIVTLKLSELGVAEWWLTQFKIPPALSGAQFDNITQFEFQTGSNAPPGDYAFRIRRITLRGHLISEATYYVSILIVWAVLIGLYLLYRIVKLRRDLERRRHSQAAALRLAQYAEEAARHDHLTKLLNRAGVTDLYHRMAMDRRGHGAFAAILLDVDHFKAVNDTHGHAVGDEVLATIATVLTEQTRAEDIVGRWGGEEFLLICGIDDRDGALGIANKLRKAIEAREIEAVGHVTASLGVYFGSGQMASLEDVAAWADAALYAAKEQGRNRALPYEPFMRAAA